MNDLEVMKRAKQYIESLAKGIDPISGNEVGENDVVNNVRVSRCLFYTAEVLQKVIDNGGEVQRERLKRSERAEFALTDEQSAALRPADDSLFISKVVNLINGQIDELTMKKLQAKTVNDWLMEHGLLKEIIINGKSHKNPTSEGEAVGITLHSYFSRDGLPLKGCFYSAEAQQFIFDNIDAIAAFAAEKNAQKAAEKEELRRYEAYDDGTDE